jgi:hypothetical protein
LSYGQHNRQRRVGPQQLGLTDNIQHGLRPKAVSQGTPRRAGLDWWIIAIEKVSHHLQPKSQ